MRKKIISDFRISYHPAVYFFIFTAGHLLMTYGSLSFEAQLWVLFLGYIFPIFFLIAAYPKKPTGALSLLPTPLPDFPPAATAWLLAAGVLATRFSVLLPSYRWQTGDEFLTGMTALELMPRWHWSLFQSFGQVPTTAVHICYLFLKIWGDPFFSLHFPMAAASSLTVLMGYLAARQFFPRSFSLIAAFFLTFNPWAILVGRNFIPCVFLPLWECWVFYALGRLFNSPDPKSKKIWACVLGASTGLGYLTFTSWPVVLLWIIALAVPFLLANRSKIPSLPRLFFAFLGLALLPLILAVYHGDFGQHLRTVSIFKNISTLKSQTQVILDYLWVIFWGGPEGMFVPVRGGFLNMVAGSLFLLGVIELFRFRRSPLAQALLGAIPLFLLPGFLAVGLETYRILPLLPVLILISVLGLQGLGASFPLRQRPILLSALLAASLCLDFTLSFPPAPQANDEIPFYYEIIKDRFTRQGPGLILTELAPETQDLSLTYSTYPFNGFWLPERFKNSPVFIQNFKWIGVLTDASYVPLLSARFPQSQWMASSRRYRLGIFPITPQTLAAFDQWQKFYFVFQGIHLQTMNRPDGKSREEVLKSLAGFYPRVPDDPFLQSCFFEKLLFNYSWEKTFHPEDTWANFENFSPLFRQAFEKSYQTAYLCEKYGRLLASEGMDQSARKPFEKALKLYPGNAWIQSQIKELAPSGPKKHL